MSSRTNNPGIEFPKTNTRFYLHGPVDAEIKAEDADAFSGNEEAFNESQQKEARKSALEAANLTGEMLDDGAPEDEVESSIEPDPEDRAAIDPEEHAEHFIDPHYWLKEDGSVWPWWHLAEGSASVRSRGHKHVVKAEYNKYWQQGSDPGGFYYLRDGFFMRKFFPRLVDALSFIENEIQAQFDFERRIWVAARVRGMPRARQLYVLEHVYYSDRIKACEEFLDTL
jgi:hypothetical protein